MTKKKKPAPPDPKKFAESNVDKKAWRKTEMGKKAKEWVIEVLKVNPLVKKSEIWNVLKEHFDYKSSRTAVNDWVNSLLDEIRAKRGDKDDES